MEPTAITSRLSTRRGGSSSATNHGGSRNLFFFVLSGLSLVGLVFNFAVLKNLTTSESDAPTSTSLSGSASVLTTTLGRGGDVSAVKSEADEVHKAGQEESSIQAWSSPHQVDCKSLVEDTPDEIYKETTTNHSFLMNIHPPAKDQISQRIWNEGCWECRHIEGMISALKRHEDSYFLDIGGNIGMWSLSAAAAKYQTVTMEVLPLNYRRFCLSVNKNSFHNRTHLLNVAATEEMPATFRFQVPKDKNFGGTGTFP